MPVSLDCPFLIAPSIFSSVYLHLLILSEMYYGMQLSNEKEGKQNKDYTQTNTNKVNKT
jgi:hypothetical protein